MSERLAQILEREKIVEADVLEEAQRRQVVYEGSLDTNLLELGAVDEASLLDALGDAYRSPIGSKEDIDAIEAHIPRIFPLQFAEAYRMVPYRLNGPTLSVLLNTEPDPQLFDRIRQRLRLQLDAVITTEVRLHYAMHRLYATRLLPRFLKLLEVLDGEAPQPGYQPATDEHFLSWGLPSGRLEATRSDGIHRSGPDIAALLARLDTAPNRDGVIKIFMEIAYGVFDFVCMFVVQGDVINGWRGIDPEHTAQISQISVPVSEPNVFQTVFATHSHYLGRLQDNRFNDDLLKKLGRESPRTALLAPILVRGKLVAVLYADNAAQSVASRRVAGLLLLTHRVGMCLERLIRQRKRTPSAKDSPDLMALQATHATVPPPLSDPSTPPLDEAELLGNDVASLSDDVEIEDETEAEKQAVTNWEDVVVDTSDATSDEAQAAPGGVTWEEVIAEAEAAPRLGEQVEVNENQIEVAGTSVDPVDLLFDSLSAQDDATRQSAVDQLLDLGPAIDNQITARFPGDLDSDVFDINTRLPSFERCSGLCALLFRRGQSVAALVEPFTESQDRNQRFLATYFFLAVHYPPAIGALAQRLYDVEARIRYLAADALRGYTGESTYRQVLQALREQLEVAVVETQVTTVQVLGQLRDPRAVPSLIPLLVSSQPVLRTAAGSALRVICCQAFDKDVERWADWWRKSYRSPRESWLVASLRHPDLEIQSLAFNELQLMTGYTGRFDSHGPADEKEAVVLVWEAWLRELEACRTSAAKNKVDSPDP